MKDDSTLKEGIDFYYESGFMVFTEKFHLKRGFCCGNGCRNCPYNYVNVPEPKRSILLENKSPRNKKKLKTNYF